MTSNNKPKDPDSILRSRFNKTKEEIEKLSLSEKWKIIYSAPKKGRDNRDPICFTGFDTNEEKEDLIELIKDSTIYKRTREVRKSTKFLVCGAGKPGPVKMEKAEQYNVKIIKKPAYLQLIKTGELP